MTRPKRVPKPIVVDTMALVKAQITTLPHHTKAYMLLTAATLTSLDNLARGQVSQSDVNDITAMGYMSLALYNLGLGVDEKQSVIDGIKAINAIGERYKTKGVYRGTGSELQAIRTLVGIHVSQLNEATIKHLAEARDFVKASMSIGR